MHIEDVNSGDAGEVDHTDVNEQDQAGGDGKKGPTGWIPKQRLDEVLGEVRELRASLQQERDERVRLEATRQQQDTPQRYTKAQLKEAVAIGQMTQDQADDTWDQQREAEITARVTSEVGSMLTDSQVTTTVAGDLGRYKELLPEIMVAGSEQREKVMTEFNFLAGLHGQPKSKKERLAMELAATRAAFGPIERIEKHGKGRPAHEHHEETGGGDRPNGGGGKKSLIEQAPERYRKYYEGLIAKGQLTKEQAEKEIARTGIKVLQERAKRYSA